MQEPDTEGTGAKVEVVATGSGTGSVKRGRDVSSTWALFTDESDPHKKKSAVCNHCKERVTYHKKSEYVHKHLNNCKAFIKLMMGMDIADRPEWLDTSKKNYTEQHSRGWHISHTVSWSAENNDTVRIATYAS